MFLNVKELEVRKIHFAESLAPGRIDFSEFLVRQATSLETEGVAELLENTGGEIRIKGSLKVTMESDCDRCLVLVRVSIDEKFDLFYRPIELDEAGDEVALDEGTAEIGFYEGLGLELADLLKEQVMLSLPMQRVCREDCKGICPVCGGNRNENPCTCAAKPVDDRWGPLKKLVNE